MLAVFCAFARGILTETSLATVKNSPLHFGVRLEGHAPRILADNDILEASAGSKDIIGPADTLSHGQNIQVIAKEVEVDVGLDQRVGAVQSDLTLGQRAQQVDDNRHVVALLRKRVVPLEGGAEHADKVKLEVRLTSRAKGIETTVGSLGLAVSLVLLEALINSREANKLKKARADGASLVALILSDSSAVGGAVTEDIILHAIAVLDLEDEGNNGVVQEMLADMGRVNLDINAVLGQFLGGANTREHQELGGLENTLRHNNLAASVDAELIVVGRVDDGNTKTGIGARVNDQLLGLNSVEDANVGLVLEVQEAALTLTAVDGIDTVGQATHLTVVNVLSEDLALGDPGLSQSVSPGLHLRDQISVSNLDGATGANLLQLGRVELLLVVIGCTLAEVIDTAVPVPLRTTKLLPVVESRLRAGNPGEVVGARRSTKSLATGVGLLNSLVVIALDHCRLVCPVMLAAAQVEGLRGSGDLGNLVGVGDTSLDDQDADVGVFGEATSNSVASGAATNDDEVVLVSVGDESHDWMSIKMWWKRLGEVMKL